MWKKLLPFVILCSIILVIGPLLVKAQGLPNPLHCGGQPVETINDLVGCITEALKLLVIPIATIMIIWGGIQYLTSMGNEERTRKAKNTLLYAVIGIVVVLTIDFIIDLIKEILNQIQ